MSLYRKYAQGEVLKTDFNLTMDNIDYYINSANLMNQEIKWLKTLLNLYSKLENPELYTESLYSEEYIRKRIAKIESERTMTEFAEQINIDKELIKVEKEIDIMRPLVLDAVEGTKVENHEKMSHFVDLLSSLEEQRNDIYGLKYKDLKSNLPKIYYMILEGVDIDTVNSCFIKMKNVLNGKITAEAAASSLMDESSVKYNLPKTIYDPIRPK